MKSTGNHIFYCSGFDNKNILIMRWILIEAPGETVFTVFT